MSVLNPLVVDNLNNENNENYNSLNSNGITDNKKNKIKNKNKNKNKTILYPPTHYSLLAGSKFLKVPEDFHFNPVKSYKNILENAPVYSITASILADALHSQSTSPLQPSNSLFPWLHGLHPDNTSQLSLLDPNNIHVYNPPKLRSILLVRFDPDYICINENNINLSDNNEHDNNIIYNNYDNSHSHSQYYSENHLNTIRHNLSSSEYKMSPFLPGSLKGAVTPPEIIFSLNDPYYPGFLPPPSIEKISLRNFYLQVSRFALISDIVIYSPLPGDEINPNFFKQMISFAQKISTAQLFHRNPSSSQDSNTDNDSNIKGNKSATEDSSYSYTLADNFYPYPSTRGQMDVVDEEYNTFVVTDPFSAFETHHSDLVSIDSLGNVLSRKENFIYQEKKLTSELSAASELTPGVFLGNIVDVEGLPDAPTNSKEIQKKWDVFIECADNVKVPSNASLKRAQHIVESRENYKKSFSPVKSTTCGKTLENHLSFPIVKNEIPDKFEANKLMIAHLLFPSSGALALGNCSQSDLDSIVDTCEWIYNVTKEYPDVRILILCNDGYTESSLLAICYIIFALGIPAYQAYIDIHKVYGRPLFTFPVDVSLIMYLQSALLRRSPEFLHRIHSKELPNKQINFYKMPTINFSQQILSGVNNESINTDDSSRNEKLSIDTDTNPNPNPNSDTVAKSTSNSNVPITWVPQIPNPAWFFKFDGSLPSRILPHMYLGNLSHANNPMMLRELGITRVLCVGERPDWSVDLVYEHNKSIASCTTNISRSSFSNSTSESVFSSKKANFNNNSNRSPITPNHNIEAIDVPSNNTINEGYYLTFEDSINSDKGLNTDDIKVSMDLDLDSNLDTSSASYLVSSVPEIGIEEFMYVDNLQDDGVDSLSGAIEECLSFLDKGYRNNAITLVHCRVGVSRSASICIAEVMHRLDKNLPDAYLFVRSRRLNVIIQPNLRFMYELLEWEQKYRKNKLMKNKSKTNSFKEKETKSENLKENEEISEKKYEDKDENYNTLGLGLFSPTDEKSEDCNIENGLSNVGLQKLDLNTPPMIEDLSFQGINGINKNGDEEFDSTEYLARRMEWVCLCREISAMNRIYMNR